MTMLIALVAGIIIFMFIMGIVSLFQSGGDEADRRVKNRLRALSMSGADVDAIDLVLRESSMSEVPWFNRLLEKMHWAANINTLIKQADADRKSVV